IFGPLIADQVADLTRIKNGYKISSKELIESLWLQKKYDLLLIKLIDRLHNMQTIHAKPIDKIQKTVTETVQSFIAFAMHAQFKDLETIMYQLC
ncbi:guanosine polyphosphate pyrophosphohydrolase/synthetase, partial [Genlisea aurea]